MAISRSGRLGGDDAALAGDIVEALMKIGQAKSYLRTICCEAVLDVIGCVGSAVLETNVAPAISTVLAGWKEASPEAVALLLSLEANGVQTPAPSDWLLASPVASVRNYPKLAQILATAPGSAPGGVPAAWRLIAVSLSSGSAAEVKEFWRVFVDDSLFHHERATHERKALGFKLLGHYLQVLAPSQVPMLLSKNLLRSLVTNLGSSSNYLHAAAKTALNAVLDSATTAKEDSVRFGLVAELVGPNGSLRFDALTKTSAVETILSGLSLAGVKSYVKRLQADFLAASGGGTEGGADAHREFVIDQMYALLRNTRVPRDEEWTLVCAKFMFFHAFCVVGSNKGIPTKLRQIVAAPDVPITPRIRSICAARFASAVAELSAAKPFWGEGAPDDPTMRSREMDGITADGDLRLGRLLTFARELQETKGVSMLVPLSDEAGKAQAGMVDRMLRLRKLAEANLKRKAGDSSAKGELAQFRAFEMFFANLGLHLYTDFAGVLEVADDLMAACDDIFPKTKATKTKAADEEAPEVLVDILLSFLGKPSSLLRNVVGQVFRAFSGDLNLAAMDLLLGAATGDTGDDEGSDSDDEDDEGQAFTPEAAAKSAEAASKRKKRKAMTDFDMGHHSDDSDDSDAASGDGEVDEDEDTGADASDDDDIDDSDDSASDGEVDEELKQRLAESLGVNLGDGDGDAGETDDEEWDDEQMMKIDDALAAQFKLANASRQNKEDKKEETRSAMHFKMRVVDLLETFVRKQSANPLIIELCAPLLGAFDAASRDNETQPLAQRLQGLLKNKLCTVKECPRVAGLDVERCHDHLETVFKMVQTASNNKVAELGSSVLLFIVRILIGADATASTAAATPRDKAKGKKGTSKSSGATAAGAPSFGLLDSARVAKLYRTAFNDFCTKKNTLIRPDLLQQLCRRYPAFAATLASDFAGGIASGLNDYRKLQATGLLQTLLQHRKVIAASPTSSTWLPLTCNTAAAGLAAYFTAAAVASSTTKAKVLSQLMSFTTALVKALAETGSEIPTGLSAGIETLVGSDRLKAMPQVKNSAIQVLALISGVGKPGNKSKAKAEVAGGNGRGEAKPVEKVAGGKAVGDSNKTAEPASKKSKKKDGTRKKKLKEAA